MRLASLLRYAPGRAARRVPDRARASRHAERRRRRPEPALTRAIEELTRPVDAIKHQAKTVTVGISRSDETLLAGAARAGGARRRRAPRPPQLPDAAHARRRSIRRSTRSSGSRGTASTATPTADQAIIAVVDRGGIGRDLPSRTERNPRLRGTKHRVAVEREVMAARGRADGRTVVFVPEVKDPTRPASRCCTCASDRLPAATARGVLEGYRPLRRARRRGHRDRADVPRRPARLDRRRRPAHRVDPAPRRPLALVIP